MNKVDAIISVAGWEERFVRGLEKDIDAVSPAQIVMLAFAEFLAMTEQKRTEAIGYAEGKGVDCKQLVLRREPKEIWRALRNLFGSAEWNKRSVLMDITTMPREVIWWTLSFLKQAQCSISFVYHRAASYSSAWLTRDTAQPRLVYQYSGIAKLGKPTCLLLLNGFDIDRSAHMVQYFEPKLLLLGLQSGSQFGNEEKNVGQAVLLNERIKNISTFKLDAFGEDAGYAAILEAVNPVLSEFNIVAASLGPKTSAISLFQLISTHPEIALAYAPSMQFNPEYSEGIGESIMGTIGEVSPIDLANV